MTQIKSETLRNSLGSYEESVRSAFENIALGLKAVVVTSVIIAEAEAEERHAKELEALKEKAVDRANITMGAMILVGYKNEEKCVKYIQELIDELKKLNE